MLPSGPADYGYQNFLGIGYAFGGKSPDEKFDCSGLISECLKAYNLLPYNALLNSQMLYDTLKDFGINSEIKKDSLLFFGRSVDEIDHVAICMNEWQMLEAAGESRKPTLKGSVRVRPIAIRKNLVAVVRLDFH